MSRYFYLDWRVQTWESDYICIFRREILFVRSQEVIFESRQSCLGKAYPLNIYVLVSCLFSNLLFGGGSSSYTVATQVCGVPRDWCLHTRFCFSCDLFLLTENAGKKYKWQEKCGNNLKLVGIVKDQILENMSFGILLVKFENKQKMYRNSQDKSTNIPQFLKEKQKSRDIRF